MGRKDAPSTAGISALPEMGGRPPPVHGLGSVDDVHRGELLLTVRDRGTDGREPLARLGDRVARVVDDSPTPVTILRSAERRNLHRLRLLRIVEAG